MNLRPAVLGAYTNKAGATVVTSGSTDRAHGLAGRDPQIEQITRNVLAETGMRVVERFSLRGHQRNPCVGVMLVDASSVLLAQRRHDRS